MELTFRQLGERRRVRFEYLRHDIDIVEVQGQAHEGQPEKKNK